MQDEKVKELLKELGEIFETINNERSEEYRKLKKMIESGSNYSQEEIVNVLLGDADIKEEKEQDSNKAEVKAEGEKYIIEKPITPDFKAVVLWAGTQLTEFHIAAVKGAAKGHADPDIDQGGAERDGQRPFSVSYNLIRMRNLTTSIKGMSEKVACNRPWNRKPYAKQATRHRSEIGLPGAQVRYSAQRITC